MKIQQYQTSVGHRVLWIVLGVFTFTLIVCAVVYATSGSIFGWNPFGASPQPTTGNNAPSTQQIDSGSQIKGTAVQDGKSSGSDQPTPPIVQNDSRLLVQVDITSVNKIDSITRVGVLISVLDQSGTCTLTVALASGEAVYSAFAGIQAMSNSSTCKGFDVPNSNLPASGYTITVNYASDNKYGVAHYDKT